MDMPEKIFVNEFLDGAEQKWIGLNTTYIRADLVNELIAAMDGWMMPHHIVEALDKLKALGAE